MTRLDMAALAAGVISAWLLLVWMAYGASRTLRAALWMWAREAWGNLWRIPERALPEWPYVRSWAERVAEARLRPFEDERRERLAKYLRTTLALQSRKKAASAKVAQMPPPRREARG